MKNLFTLLLTATLAIGCGTDAATESKRDYGTEVAIDEKNIVYCKGKGITETDARALGAYLFQLGLFQSSRAHAAQLEKEKDIYIVRLDFHDKRAYDALINARSNAGLMEDIYSAMRIVQALISQKVFAGAHTRVILATDTFYEFAFAGDELTQEEKEMVNSISAQDTLFKLQHFFL